MPRAAEYWSRRHRGLCVECPVHSRDLARCAACQEKHSADKRGARAKVYWLRKRARMCVDCGGNLRGREAARCGDCVKRERNSERKRKRRQRRAA